jgi:hypothetical protein
VSIDVSALLANEVIPALNAATAADLVFWTAAELYQFADDAVKEAARRSLIFVSVAPLALAIGAGDTALPAGTVAVLAAAFANLPLRAATVAEIEALDDNWEQTTGPPAKWLEDAGITVVRTYPAPSVAGTLSVVLQGFPSAPISAGNTAIEAPAPFAGYLLQAMLGRARGKQSDAMMPEIADHCAQREGIYRQIFTQYWGAGE